MNCSEREDFCCLDWAYHFLKLSHRSQSTRMPTSYLNHHFSGVIFAAHLQAPCSSSWARISSPQSHFSHSVFGLEPKRWSSACRTQLPDSSNQCQWRAWPVTFVCLCVSSLCAGPCPLKCPSWSLKKQLAPTAWCFSCCGKCSFLDPSGWNLGFAAGGQDCDCTCLTFSGLPYLSHQTNRWHRLRLHLSGCCAWRHIVWVARLGPTLRTLLSFLARQ